MKNKYVLFNVVLFLINVSVLIVGILKGSTLVFINIIAAIYCGFIAVQIYKRDKKMARAINITQEEYIKAQDSYQGICKVCGEFRDQCEPDAEEYECPHCGSNAVQGIENALISGTIELEG